MAVILSGKEVAEQKKIDIRRRVQQLKSNGVQPTLDIAMVGDREDSLAYIKGAHKALDSCGIECRVSSYPETITIGHFIGEIQKKNNDDSVHGIIIMRPLPGSLDWKMVEETLSPAKDVDCITPSNLAGVFSGLRDVFYPCTAQAVIDILDYYHIDLKGKNVAVVGRSMVVGKPVSMMLLQRDATVTISHSKTADLEKVVSAADIVVAAAGKPGLVKDRHVKQGAVVIDVGINFVEGRLVGDVDFDSVEMKASMITPVPGGVGSVTTGVLMEHIAVAAENICINVKKI